MEDATSLVNIYGPLGRVACEAPMRWVKYKKHVE